jgi:hypothetical protein
MPRPPITLPKRYLTAAEVQHVYNCSPDYLESVDVADLPRNRRGHRTVLYDVGDLERHFARFRVAGDEGHAPAPAAMLPVVAFVPAA